MVSKIDIDEFKKAFNKVKNGKQWLSDKSFLKFRTEELNSLGKFYDPQFSEKNFKDLLKELSQPSLKLKNYTAVVIPKSNGKPRTILVPHPRDRIIFSILLDKIKKGILVEMNDYNIFGSGGRDDFRTVKDILEHVRKVSLQYSHVLKIDIEAFFPSVNKDLLIEMIEDKVKEPYFLDILKNSFNNHISFKFDAKISDSYREQVKKDAHKGIPQGCAYSPLLANYYAIALDKKVKEKDYPAFRYLDDMIVFCNSEKEAKNLLEELHLVAKSLELKIHPLSDKNNNKTYIQKTKDPFEYLGIDVIRKGDFSIPIKKIKNEVKLIKSTIINQQTIKRFTVSKVYRVFSEHLKGWRRYYESNFPLAYANFKKDYPEYNKKLKMHYEKHPSFKIFVRKKIKLTIDDKSLYL